MRAYYVRITEPKSGDVLALYTSFKPDGTTNGAALKIEFDIPVYAYGDPVGGARVKISGVNFSDIVAARNLNDMNIEVYGGMAKGLPLANPAQAGVLLKGQIFQAYGNWQGREVSLEFIAYAQAGTNNDPANISYTWRTGTPLGDAVKQVLQIAYPGAPITGNLSSSLIYPQDQPWNYKTLPQFGKYVLDTSRAIIRDNAYPGASLWQLGAGFFLTDGTAPPKAKPISFLDLIGQPTWVDPGTMQFRTVLRADLNGGDVVQMPEKSLVNVTSGAAVSGLTKDKFITAFKGQFTIRNIRHLGDSRQNSAESWISVFDTYVGPPT